MTIDNLKRKMQKISDRFIVDRGPQWMLSRIVGAEPYGKASAAYYYFCARTLLRYAQERKLDGRDYAELIELAANLRCQARYQRDLK